MLRLSSKPQCFNCHPYKVRSKARQAVLFHFFSVSPLGLVESLLVEIQCFETVDGKNPAPLQTILQNHPRSPFLTLEGGTKGANMNAQNPASPDHITKTTLKMGRRVGIYTPKVSEKKTNWIKLENTTIPYTSRFSES